MVTTCWSKGTWRTCSRKAVVEEEEAEVEDRADRGCREQVEFSQSEHSCMWNDIFSCPRDGRYKSLGCQLISINNPNHHNGIASICFSKILLKSKFACLHCIIAAFESHNSDLRSSRLNRLRLGRTRACIPRVHECTNAHTLRSHNSPCG